MDHDLELIVPNPGNRWNLFLAVEPPRRGFFSAKNNIPLIFGHVQSQEIALFLDFGPHLAPIWSLLSLIEPY